MSRDRNGDMQIGKIGPFPYSFAICIRLPASTVCIGSQATLYLSLVYDHGFRRCSPTIDRDRAKRCRRPLIGRLGIPSELPADKVLVQKTLKRRGSEAIDNSGRDSRLFSVRYTSVI